ncbi:hypothetical protein M1590_03185 [Candidatus Marsarchaeota archaeon]|nr:hypothetical protein [Candidatus Marsarchaeota archaeon]
MAIFKLASSFQSLLNSEFSFKEKSLGILPFLAVIPSICFLQGLSFRV